MTRNHRLSEFMKSLGRYNKPEPGEELMGIQVLDHVIIGREKYYSFADKGEICSGVPLFRMKEGPPERPRAIQELFGPG